MTKTQVLRSLGVFAVLLVVALATSAYDALDSREAAAILGDGNGCKCAGETHHSYFQACGWSGSEFRDCCAYADYKMCVPGTSSDDCTDTLRQKYAQAPSYSQYEAGSYTCNTNCSGDSLWYKPKGESTGTVECFVTYSGCS